MTELLFNRMDLVQNRTNLSIFMKVRPKRTFRTKSCESFMKIHESEAKTAVSYEIVRILHEFSWKWAVSAVSYKIVRSFHENSWKWSQNSRLVWFRMNFHEFSWKWAVSAVSYEIVRSFHENSWKWSQNGRLVQNRTNLSWIFMKVSRFSCFVQNSTIFS